MPDFDIGNFLGNLGTNLVNNVGTSLTNAASNPLLIGAIGTGIQGYQNADKYDDLAKDIKKEGNPFGDQRQQYADRLSALYADPSSLANDPGYKFRLSQGMGKMSGQQAASHAGWGNEFGAMQNYAQGLASTEMDNAVNRLSKLAGADIGPTASINGQIGLANAAVNQRNGALQGIFSAFGQQPGQGGGSGSGSGGNGSWLSNGNYKLPNGDEVDVEKLAYAARVLKDPNAIAMLTKISGGATTDQNIKDLTTGDERDGTGVPSGDPYNPDGGAGLNGPPGYAPDPDTAGGEYVPGEYYVPPGYDGGDPGYTGDIDFDRIDAGLDQIFIDP